MSAGISDKEADDDNSEADPGPPYRLVLPPRHEDHHRLLETTVRWMRVAERIIVALNIRRSESFTPVAKTAPIVVVVSEQNQRTAPLTMVQLEMFCVVNIATVRTQ